MNTPDGTAKRILIVEDEPSIADVFQIVLTREGFEVEIAVNGRVAQDMIEEKQYHLCIIDIRMPKMSGEELYQWLQKKYPKMADGVVFTTGSVIDRKTITFVGQSGRPLLPKPFAFRELRAVVEETLKQIEK
jgi:DNA-binding response OmpR family regulator